MTSGELLRKYRELRRMTQDELAAQTGIAATSISKIEHGGRKVTLEEAVRLARALDVSLGALAGVAETNTVQIQTLQAMQRVRESMFELEKSLSFTSAGAA